MQKYSQAMVDTEFVFDLDDTLYPERDYVLSALSFAAGIVDQLYRVSSPRDRLLEYMNLNVSDPIGALWVDENLPISAKAEVVAAMRAHIPDIALRDSALQLLEKLRRQGRGFSIVTDGRSVTQRAKLAALRCLDAKFISISEEVGLEKTNVLRFLPVEAKFPASKYIYVGDNPAKDFIAPNKLNWTTVMLIDDGRHTHRQSLPNDAINDASLKIASLGDLLELKL